MLDIITLLIFILTLTLAFVRGFIKEIFGLCGIILSFALTYYNYNFFSGVIGIKSQLVANLVSSFMMYMVVIISITIINSGIMYVLRPIRLGATDRILGLMIGVIKGLIFSFAFFLIVKLLYYTFSTEVDNKEEEKILPQWVMQSKVYAPFHYMEENLDQVLPQYIYNNIKEFGNKLNEETATQLKEEEQKTKDNKQVSKTIINEGKLGPKKKDK